MKEDTVKIEIYEGDPFKGCCGPGIASVATIEKLRNMLVERNHIVKRLRNELKDQVEVEREIISRRRWDYPGYVRKLLAENKPLPYIFFNGEAVSIGKFPSYEEFQTLLKPYFKK